MRVFVDMATDRILQGDSTPEAGSSTIVNGKWVFPIPEGAAVTVGPSTTVASLETDSLSEFLVRYPMYDFIIGNWFTDVTDIGDIAATPGSGANPGPLVTPLRYWSGRKAALPNPGVAPNCVTVPPVNTKGLGNQAGQLVVGTIDLAVADGTFPGIPGGTDEVMLWWKIARFNVSEDVVTSYGGWTPSGTNDPALKYLQEETTQAPAWFEAYVSNDDGVTWYQAYYLEPIDMVNLGTNFRVAFVNNGDSPVQLLGFCALFPDTWP